MPPHVLLVDDDEFARGFARTVLQRAGYAVVEVEDVCSALASAAASEPSVVVTDWNLPDGDGGSLARTLHATITDLPVILITGDAEASSQSTDDIGSPFVNIISKPFSPSALTKAMRDVLVR